MKLNIEEAQMSLRSICKQHIKFNNNLQYMCNFLGFRLFIKSEYNKKKLVSVLRNKINFTLLSLHLGRVGIFFS